MRKSLRDTECGQSAAMLKIIVIISAICFNGLYAAPSLPKSNDGGCSEVCPQSNKGSKLNYQPGQQYIYKFENNVAVSLSGNEQQEVTLAVSGQAKVLGLSECQFGLVLENVHLLGPDNKKNKLIDTLPLSKLVRFTLSNDKLEPEICADPSDTTFSLNIKRAIISLLQSNNAESHETDVFGTCATTFTVTAGNNGEKLITKSRDLNACSHRESLANGLVNGILNEKSGVKSTPLLNGDYNSEQRINKNGIIQASQVTEEYSLVPFSNGNNGAKARVVTKLVLNSQQGNAPRASTTVSVPRSLVFENADKPIAGNKQIALTALKNTVATYENNVGPKTASHFTELIRILRFVKQEDLLTLRPTHQNEVLARKVYLDALFRVGTADSVGAIATLLKTGKISDKTAIRLAYLSFSLATAVNKETLVTIQKLLETKLPKEAFLSIGNLIKKYCQKNSCDGNELDGLFNELLKKLNDCKAEAHKGDGWRKREDQIVAILKGFRSAKNLSAKVLDRLVLCSTDPHSSRVRVASIQALAADACNKRAQTAALTLLKNRNEDAEIRIEAYLALVECPTPETAKQIKSLLDEETSNQVGSFITTHLANLRASTDLHREQAREHLIDVRTNKKFPSDIRQYSFNHELSYALESLGLGASTDTNVIYSKKSFLPRSVRTNLTGELFGTNFNILDLNLRQENLDLLLERYFGPKGKWNTVNKQEVIASIGRKLHGDDGKRSRRGLREDAQEFAQKSASSGSALNQDLDLDFSLKLFGSDLFFLSLDDSFPLDSRDLERKLKSQWEQYLKKVKEGSKHEWDLHSLFLDAEFIYPTSIGFPLKIQVQGTGVARLQTELKADLKDIVKNPKNAQFLVKVVPSFNVEISGTLSVDGFAVETGLQVSSYVHSSTGAQLSFKLTDQGKGVNVNVEFPSTKQELFSFNHKIVFITQELGRESVATTLPLKVDTTDKNKKSTVSCFDQLRKYIGVNVCFEYNHSLFNKGTAIGNVLPFPLNGPTLASAWIDVDKKFEFNAKYDDSVEKRRALSLVFDTPESSENRKVTLKLEAEIEPKVYARIELISPLRTASAEIGFKNDQSQLLVYGEANNEKDKYIASFGFRKSGQKPRQEYTPIVEYSKGNGAPDNLGYAVSGKVIVDHSQAPKVKYQFENLKIEPLRPDAFIGPLTLNGLFEREGNNNFGIALDVKHRSQSGHVTGTLKLKEKELDLAFGIISNFNELANGKVELYHKRSDTQLKNSFVIVYDKDLESKTKRIELSQDYHYEKKEDGQIKSLVVKNRINASPIHLEVVLNGAVQEKHLDYDVSAQFKQHKLSSNLNVDRDRTALGDWDGKLDVGVNAHKLNLESKRAIDVNAQRSTITNKVTSSFGTKIDINSVFDHVLNRQRAYVKVDGLLKLAKDQPECTVAYLLSVTPKVATTTGSLKTGNVESLSLNIVLNRNAADGNPNDGTLSLNVKDPDTSKDILSAKGELTSTKGTCQSSVVVSLPIIGRKIKITTTGTKNPQQLDLSTEVLYNFEKDNSRRISLSTKNKYTETEIESDNELDLDSEKYVLNFNGKISGVLRNGKINGGFLVRLPSLREISGTLNRVVDSKAPKATGNFNIKLTDTVNHAGQKKARSLAIDCELKEGNLQERLFDLSHKFTLTDFEGKDIVSRLTFKHLPKGDYKVAATSLSVSGSHIPNAITLEISADEYCPVHAVFHVNVRHGKSVAITLKGNYALGERGAKPSTYKIDLKANIPETKLEELSLVSSGSFKTPALNDPNGKYVYEVTLNGGLNKRKLVLQLNGEGSKRTGKTTLNLNLPETEPLSVDLTYSNNGLLTESQGDGSVHEAEGSASIKYGNGKHIQFNADTKLINGKSAVIHGRLSTPFEQAKSLEVTLKTTKTQENAYNNEISLVVDSKKYNLVSDVVVSKHNPSVKVIATYPTGQSQLGVTVTRINDRKFKGSVQLTNINGFSLVADGEVTYQNVESFGLILDVDSEKLKANKLHVEVQSKHTDSGKGVEFSASQQNNNIVTGYADYTVREEKGKTIVDGKGTIKWYEKAGSASILFVKNDFDEPRDNETGFSLVFNGDLGPKNIIAEIKLTNKNFHIRHTICEEKNSPCVNFGINSTILHADWNNFKHNLLVVVDLRKLGFAHEFILNSDTTREGLVLLHDLDIQLKSDEKNKYQYHFYVERKKSGVELVIPSRTVAIEAVYNYPETYLGRYVVGVTSYWDKNNAPDKKSSVHFSGAVEPLGKSKLSYKVNGELSVTHPQVKQLKISGKTELKGEEQSVSGQLKLDIFKTTKQAIIINANFGNSDRSENGFNLTSAISLISKDLALDYSLKQNAGLNLEKKVFSFVNELVGPTSSDRFGLYVSGSTRNLDFSLAAFNEDLIKANAQLDLDKRIAAVEATIRLLGTEPILATARIVPLSAASASVTRGSLLKLSADFKVDKELSLIVIGSGKTLLSGKIALDKTNLLATDYELNSKEFKDFVKGAKNTVTEDTKRGRDELVKRYNNIKQSLTKQVNNIKENVPDFKGVNNELKQEWQKLSDALLADKNIKSWVEFYRDTYDTLNKSVGEIVRTLIDHFNKATQILTDLFKQLYEGFNEKILPSLKESLNRVELILRDLYEEALRVALDLFERFIDILKKHEEDLKKLGESARNWLRKWAEGANKYTDAIRQEVEQIWNLILDTIKSSPGLESIRERVQEALTNIIVPDNIIGPLREIAATLKDTIQINEVNELIVSVIDYAEKKLKKIQVNDLDALKKIANNVVKAIKAVVELVHGPLNSIVDTSGANTLWGIPIPFSFQKLQLLPQLTSFKLSLWNYLRHEPLPSLPELIQTYRPQRFNPLNLLPPFERQGSIIDGQYLFTYGGRLVTLSGSCQYVVAEDVVGGNFTVAANIANGKLRSIGIVDKSGESVEVNQEGLVTLNGAQVELPLYGSSVFAWRRYYGVQLLSKYGVRVHCTTDLNVCHIFVNGFYHNKLRGLLGNGNGEWNDDLQLPNGEISNTLSGFVNAYKLQESCPAVAISEQHQHGKDDPQSDECNVVFGLNSNLRYCNYFIDSKPYQDACQHSVQSASNKQEAACAIALGYASKCRLENIPVSLPSVCDKCQASDLSGKPKNYAVGEEYKAKSPQKKADIVLVIDTAIESTTLSELVQHTITNLRRELANRDVSDAAISVIGFKKGDRYLSHYTTNGRLNITKFNLGQPEKNLKEEKLTSVGCNETDAVLQKLNALWTLLQDDFSLAADGAAFREALSFPFRSSASKAIIAIRSNPLVYSKNPLKSLGANLANKWAKASGIHVHLISPTPELSFDNNQKEQTVVGFNSKEVLQLSDAKKRTNVGSTESRLHLKYGSDLGIDIVQGENTGYVFSLSNFLKLKPKEKNSFLTVATSVIADQLARTVIESQCYCKLYKGLFAREICYETSTKLSPPVTAKKQNRG